MQGHEIRINQASLFTLCLFTVYSFEQIKCVLVLVSGTLAVSLLMELVQ